MILKCFLVCKSERVVPLMGLTHTGPGAGAALGKNASEASWMVNSGSLEGFLTPSLGNSRLWPGSGAWFLPTQPHFLSSGRKSLTRSIFPDIFMTKGFVWRRRQRFSFQEGLWGICRTNTQGLSGIDNLAQKLNLQGERTSRASLEGATKVWGEGTNSWWG